MQDLKTSCARNVFHIHPHLLHAENLPTMTTWAVERVLLVVEGVVLLVWFFRQWVEMAVLRPTQLTRRRRSLRTVLRSPLPLNPH